MGPTPASSRSLRDVASARAADVAASAVRSAARRLCTCLSMTGDATNRLLRLPNPAFTLLSPF